MKYKTPRDRSAPPLLSPPSSGSSSTDRTPGQANSDHDPNVIKPDARSSSAAAKKQLQTSFVPAATEAGKLISADLPHSLIKTHDPIPKGPKSSRANKAGKAKSNAPILFKKEPMTPTLPLEPPSFKIPVSQQIPTPAAYIAPPVPVQTHSAFIHPTDPTPRLLSGLPRRPSATEWVPKPQRPMVPARSLSPHSPRTPPRPYTRRSPSLSRSPSPTSPASWSRSPSPRGGRTGYDHYSPRDRRSPEPTYRPVYRREPSPPPYPSRKRARESDSWVPSNDQRIGNPPKRRAVPRSPPSPRRRFSMPDQSLPSSNVATFPSNSTTAYGAKRKNTNGPPKNNSKWPDSLPAPPRAKQTGANHAPETSLLDRMSDNISPPGPKLVRRGYLSLEHRLTNSV